LSETSLPEFFRQITGRLDARAIPPPPSQFDLTANIHLHHDRFPTATEVAFAELLAIDQGSGTRIDLSKTSRNLCIPFLSGIRISRTVETGNQIVRELGALGLCQLECVGANY
jgi:hypothetical protein